MSEEIANPRLDDDNESDARRGVVHERRKASKYMTDRELSELPLLERINWLSSIILFVPPLYLAIGACFVPFKLPTFILAFVLA